MLALYLHFDLLLVVLKRVMLPLPLLVLQLFRP